MSLHSVPLPLAPSSSAALAVAPPGMRCPLLDRPGERTNAAGRVLIVDDDPVALELMGAAAQADGYRVVTAASVRDARLHLLQDGPASFDCIITDHEMVGGTGLDLLAWSRSVDESLSVIIVTATQSRSLVQDTLRGGATNFLDKPLHIGCYRSALSEAVGRTRRARASGATLAAVTDVGRMLKGVMQFDAAHDSHLTVRHHPVNLVGGDFITTQVLSDGTLQVIFGDCSGHDLSSAFLGAYFQGLSRGLLAEGRPVAEVMMRFNETLVRASMTEWFSGGAGASLAACGVRLRREGGRVDVLNAGAPHPWSVDAEGRLEAMGEGGTMPLGWFVDVEPVSASREMPPGSAVWMYTDGVEELAEAKGVSSLALSTMVMTSGRDRVAKQLGSARDDVLVARLMTDDTYAAVDAGAPEPWFPVLHHVFRGDETHDIEAKQALIERCLQLVVPQLPEERLVDVLVSLREALLNAMEHGCAGDAAACGTLHLAIRPRARLLRAHVEDPGPGHEFTSPRDTEWNDNRVPEAHRGLAMIHAFATRVTADRRGAALQLDFQYCLPGDLP